MESVSLLKYRMFYPEKKIFTASVKGSGTEEKQIWGKMSDAYRQILDGEYKKAETGLEELICMTVKRECDIKTVEEVISEMVNVMSRFGRGGSTDTDFRILFHKYRSKDYLLTFANAEELKADLRLMVKLGMESREDEDGQDMIDMIKDYVAHNYASNLSVSEIAGKFYLNASYLSTLFKERTQMNLTSYIEGVRMEQAERMLAENRLSITEIAMGTGYSEPGYFSKVFKKYAGMTPRRFRENAQRYAS